MTVARSDQQRAIKIVRLLGDRLAQSLKRRMIGDEAEIVARRLRAYAAPPQTQHRARPVGIALRQQRQIEQPLARIIDDPEPERRGAAADAAEHVADQPGRDKADIDADLADVRGRLRPASRRRGKGLDIVHIGKTRQQVRLGAFQPGGNQPALADHLEQRHPVRVVQCAQEIVDQRGYKDGLSGAAQTGHRQPDGRALSQFGQIGDVAEPLCYIAQAWNFQHILVLKSRRNAKCAPLLYHYVAMARPVSMRAAGTDKME